MATSRTRAKLVAALTEVMPGEVRVAGISPAFGIATALLGGFTPATSTCLTQVMHDWAASVYRQGVSLRFAASCAKARVISARRRT
ncbi:hypothetical protein NL30_34200 [Burkholderia contaminans]|nr:hypothetical protein NL30_34200 [Burkholderia contaminans]